MAHTTGLCRVNLTYYFRCRIPTDIKHYFKGKEDIKRSLRTKSLLNARQLVKAWAEKTAETFMLIRSGILTPEEIKKLAEAWKHKALGISSNSRLLWHDFPESRAELQSRIEIEEISERQARDAQIFNKLNGIQSSIVDNLIEENKLCRGKAHQRACRKFCVNG